MLDQYIQRLQNMGAFNVYAITAEGVEPWYEVTGAIVHDLVLRDQDIGLQVQTISAQMALWARMTAQSRRVWEIEERHYRVWRSRFYTEATTSKEDGWKKPTEKAIEAAYRLDPEYAKFQVAIERAEEAYECARGILDAFRAKRDMIKTVVRKNRDSSEPELSV